MNIKRFGREDVSAEETLTRIEQFPEGNEDTKVTGKFIDYMENILVICPEGDEHLPQKVQSLIGGYVLWLEPDLNFRKGTNLGSHYEITCGERITRIPQKQLMIVRQLFGYNFNIWGHVANSNYPLVFRSLTTNYMVMIAPINGEVEEPEDNVIEEPEPGAITYEMACEAIRIKEELEQSAIKSANNLADMMRDAPDVFERIEQMKKARETEELLRQAVETNERLMKKLTRKKTVLQVFDDTFADLGISIMRDSVSDFKDSMGAMSLIFGGLEITKELLEEYREKFKGFKDEMKVMATEKDIVESMGKPVEAVQVEEAVDPADQAPAPVTVTEPAPDPQPETPAPVKEPAKPKEKKELPPGTSFRADILEFLDQYEKENPESSGATRAEIVNGLFDNDEDRVRNTARILLDVDDLVQKNVLISDGDRYSRIVL